LICLDLNINCVLDNSMVKLYFSFVILHRMHINDILRIVYEILVSFLVGEENIGELFLLKLTERHLGHFH